MGAARCIVILLTVIIISSACCNGQNRQSTLQEINFDEVRVENIINTRDSSKMGEEIRRFYEKRGYRTAWLENGRPDTNALELLNEIRNSDHPGLKPENYRIFRAIGNVSPADLINSTEDAATIDVLFTEAFLEYASDLSVGRIATDSLSVVWEAYPEKKDLPEYLGKALENNSIHDALYDLWPHNQAYYRLREAYDRLSGMPEWPLPGYDKPVRQNQRNGYVLKLKEFLHAAGDLQVDDSNYYASQLFDRRLGNAIRQFQERHGLDPDGIPGEGTLDEMNVPRAYRMDQVLVNLDRMRDLPSEFGGRYIIVNIPGYFLEYYDGDTLSMKMNVVVGKLEKYTPVLKDTMTYIVFNPTWNVPYSIATEEIVPLLKKDKDYAEKHNYVLLRGSYESTDTLNPADIRWNELTDITEDNFPFSIVQMPGNNNALGRIKFMFPNNYDIYLHDTPADNLFSLDQRDLSHGCIRVEKPFDLAALLLEDQVPPDTIAGILRMEKTRIVKLDKKVPVHLQYFTAWVDNAGRLQFRKDIYGIDRESIALLKKEKQ